MRKVVLIGAIWCSSCLIMRPRWQKICRERGIELCELDVDEHLQLVNQYHTGQLLPVAILLENDKEVSRLIGEKSHKEIERFFQEFG